MRLYTPRLLGRKAVAIPVQPIANLGSAYSLAKLTCGIAKVSHTLPGYLNIAGHLIELLLELVFLNLDTALVGS